MDTTPNPQLENTRRTISPGWWAAIAISLLILALLTFALLTEPSQPLVVGEMAPGFELTSMSGAAFDLESQRGRVVVVNFFASWCQPCREEASDLEGAWRQYQTQGVQFYGIAYQDAAVKAQQFIQEFDVTYPCAIEPGDRTARTYGITGVPETFVISSQGLLIQHFVGPISKAALSGALERALGE